MNSHGIVTRAIRSSERKPSGAIHRLAITGIAGMLLFIPKISSWPPAKRPRLVQIRQLVEASAIDVE